ncbi:MAG: CC0125/CC1285 family lipoprotein [Planctomycetota bacterium]|jgi:hypothetical protein
MKRLLISFGLFFVAGLCGCEATPYQRLGTTGAGGYSERAMSEDTFHVRFVANNHTEPEVVRGYLYRRAAEVTLRHGFRFFAVVRGPSALTEQRTFYESRDAYDNGAAPIEVNVPQGNRLQMVIQCFKEMPEQIDAAPIDAQQYLDEHVRK